MFDLMYSLFFGEQAEENIIKFAKSFGIFIALYLIIQIVRVIV